jgi:hypothetical protein
MRVKEKKTAGHLKGTFYVSVHVTIVLKCDQKNAMEKMPTQYPNVFIHALT